jgi:Zn-dependent peptidase ImmA (M78 family)
MSRADATARTLTDRFGLDTPAVDLDKLAGELGVLVVRQPADADVHAMLMRRNARDVVGLNERHPHDGQRYALAHALGHHQIHARRGLILDVANRYRLGRLASLPTDREEVEANRFAAALLIPEAMVRRMAAEADFETGQQLVDLLAPRFEVSRAVMGYRLMSLGIVMDY